jgi:YidC/Oxa1 family membrane protein insertase
VNENRNMVLAIVLSALVLIGWSFLADELMPANPPPVKVENGEVKPIPQPGADPAVNTPRAMRSRQQVIAETPRVRIDTPSLQGSINLQGARVDDLVLVRHRRGLGEDSPPVRLLSPAGTPGGYFASFGWTGEGVEAPGPDAIWTASAPVLAPGRPVTLSWTSPGGQRFEQVISIDENYLFSVEQRVANPTGGAIAVRPYGLVSRANKSPDPDGCPILGEQRTTTSTGKRWTRRA